jgi:hypothetical protein
VQYNNGGAFGGISGFTTDGTRVTASTTIGVGGATPSTSGSGITFPATQSQSSSANTLDDYEEGTFTVTISAGVTSPVYFSGRQEGYYTKVGNTVNYSIRIALVSGTGDGTQLAISGLPFTVSAGTSAGTTVGLGFGMMNFQNFTSTAIVPKLVENATNMVFNQTASAGTAFTTTQTFSSQYICVSGTYFTTQ